MEFSVNNNLRAYQTIQSSMIKAINGDMFYSTLHFNLTSNVVLFVDWFSSLDSFLSINTLPNYDSEAEVFKYRIDFYLFNYVELLFDSHENKLN